MNNIHQTFLALLKAGLWEQDVEAFPLGDIDYKLIFRLGMEQSVLGLVTAGLEHVKDVNIPKDIVLELVGNTLQMEQKNMAMNKFISSLFGKFNTEKIKALLVKGQGIAQCYERPLWRTCGDVDLLLDIENYRKAQLKLQPISQVVEEYFEYYKHQALIISSWKVELHGTQRTGIGHRVDAMLDRIQKEIFEYNYTREWNINECRVLLPAPNEDVLLVFTHILQHFYREGIGFKQICDWCRLLWAFREDIDVNLLKRRLRRMGILSEWKAFASLAVKRLGMQEDAMPLYSDSIFWQYKANLVLRFIFSSRSNNESIDLTYRQKYSFIVYKIISLWYRTKNSFRHAYVFPLGALREWKCVIANGVHEIVRKKCVIL